MKCPFCQSSETSVLRTYKYDSCIIRFRRCLNCDQSFKTAESYDKSLIIEQFSFTVVPTDNK